MGIKPVVYNGETVKITQENAKEILMNRSSVTQEDGTPMSTAQIKFAEAFLSEEERDEILYSDESSTERGKSAISLDADGDGKDDIESGDQQKGAGSGMATAGSVAALGATILGVCMPLQKAKEGSNINGFVALGWAIACTAGAAMALVFSFANIFDAGYKTRKAFSDATGNNTGVLDSKGEELVGNMDSMNEDAATYQEQCDDYTEATGEATSEMASLQIALADAQSMGDTARVEEIQNQIKALEDQDFSDMEDGMQETRDKMEEYSSMGMEAQGMTENGNTIAEFLDGGKTLKTLAMINAICLTVTTAMIGIAMACGSIPKIWAVGVPVDGAACVASAALFAASIAILGMASGKMWKNMSDEGKFADNGQEMHNHVDTLNSNIGQHTDYMDEITGSYDEMDEKSEEEQEQNAETATESVEKKTGDKSSVRVGGKDKEEEDPKDKKDKDKNDKK